MDREEFERQLADWLADVNSEAIRLLESGIAPELVLKLAIDIAGARLNTVAMERARSMKRFHPAMPMKN